MVAPRRNIAAVITLLFVTPLVAEYLLGDLPLKRSGWVSFRQFPCLVEAVRQRTLTRCTQCGATAIASESSSPSRSCPSLNQLEDIDSLLVFVSDLVPMDTIRVFQSPETAENESISCTKKHRRQGQTAPNLPPMSSLPDLHRIVCNLH